MFETTGFRWTALAAALLLGVLSAGAAFAAGGQITQTIDGVPFHAARGEVKSERTIQVDGSSTVLATWEERGSDGAWAPWYGISLDGSSFDRVAAASYELGFRYAHFDPLANVPAVPAQLAAGPDIGLYVVQFVTQPLESFKAAIEARGGAVREYAAQFAYIVEMSAETRAQVAALPYVRWIGPYEPAYRLEEFMLENLEHAGSVYPSLQYNVMVFAPEEKSAAAAHITAIGGAVENADAGKQLLVARLTPAQLFQVARWDQVEFVDRWGPYEPDMNIARDIGGANYIETVAGYRGEGVRGEVFDGGMLPTHEVFVGPGAHPLVQHGTIGNASHGTCCTGIVFAHQESQPNARGMMPEGQGIVCDYNYSGGLTNPGRYTRTGELLQAPYYAVVQSSSVGSPQTTQYTTISADTDQMLFDFDIVFCQSQSNMGTQNSRPQAWAKNIISGGALNHRNTLTKTDDCWCSGASIGPATDGRVKPTLCSFYDYIWTSDNCSATCYTTTFGGTSGATPIIAGHVGLFFQMWDDGIFGNPVDPTGTVFDNKPHAATARAMMINTADQYDFTGTTVDRTRMHQGWGMPSLKNLYDLRSKFFIVDETDVLLPLQVKTYYVNVAAGEPALKATMVYIDPPGNPAIQTQHRKNDLTLRVTSPSSVAYWGNAGLLIGVWSSSVGVADTKNTEENVFIQSPEAGWWKVEVIGAEIIADSHPETGVIDADFALVVSGVTGGAASSVGPAPVNGRDLAFRIQGIRPGSTDAVLSYNVPTPSHVRLALHDVLGRRVTTLVDGESVAGLQSVNWNGRDAAGGLVAPGVYYARLEVGSTSTTGKVLVVR